MSNQLFEKIQAESLEKGDVIPAYILEKITGLSKTNPKFSLACLSIKCTLESYILENTGEVVTIAFRQGNLKILMDEELPQYHIKRVGKAVRAIVDSNTKIKAIDDNVLTSSQLADARRSQNIIAHFSQALTKAAKEIKLKPAEVRIVPALHVSTRKI